MRRVLIVAYYFPPLGGIGSVRIASFAKHLPSYGWMPTVLAPRGASYYVDADLSFPEQQVIRTRSLELSRAGKRILRTGGTDTSAAAVTGVRRMLRDLARSSLYFPDAQVGWYPFAVAASRQVLRRRQFDAVFSSSFPITAHLVASHLRRELEVPWVAEFRDPWSETLPPAAPRRRAALRLERHLARAASGLVMTSPSWAAHHSQLWDRPIETILNGHDGQRRNAPPRSSSLTLSYLGTYYPGMQSLAVVWEAVRQQRLRSETRVARIRLIGPGNPTLLRELNDAGLSDLVEVTGFVPHTEAMDALGDSSILLVAGPPSERRLDRGHIVAKIAEYLGTQRPIIYVGDPEADAAELLRRYAGTFIVRSGDTEAMLQALNSSANWRGVRDSSDLSRVHLTSLLADSLDRAAR